MILQLQTFITGVSHEPSEKEAVTDLTGLIILLLKRDPKWRDLSGNYTRYGDVLPLLSESDNKYIISNAGDETSVEFNAKTLPHLAKGWKRDFLIHSVGWVKDGDINTAFGNTVLPLPFHGMKSYPPSNRDTYPDDPELQKYNREYNTRVVTADEYINAVRSNSNHGKNEYSYLF